MTPMDAITDDFMRRMLRKSRRYSMVILHRTSKRDEAGADAIVWEHGRRNFDLRRKGKLCIVCRIERDDSDVTGLCIFSTDREETVRIMKEDPAIRAGIFTYEVQIVDGFPGDSLTS
jgi:hypothetical protein